MSPSDDQRLNPSSDFAFCNTINIREDLSKLSSSIGSFNVSSEPFSVLYIYTPSFFKWDEVESTLKLVPNLEELEHVEAKVSFSNFKI